MKVFHSALLRIYRVHECISTYLTEFWNISVCWEFCKVYRGTCSLLGLVCESNRSFEGL